MIIFGKKEFVKNEEDKKGECAATTRLEDLKSDTMLKERVDKMVLKV